MNNVDNWMNVALQQAKIAYKKKDVPVGAIIIKDNKIIAKAYNKKEKCNNAIYHAEIIAIRKACKKLKTWHLENCVLYVTLEPCMMCMGAIIQSRIQKIIYASSNPNFGFVKSNYDVRQIYKIEIEQSNNFYIKQSTELLQRFFKERRK